MSLQAVGKFALAQGYVPEGWPNPFAGLAPSKKIIRKTKLNIRDFSARGNRIVHHRLHHLSGSNDGSI